jgi:hypothetical protein
MKLAKFSISILLLAALGLPASAEVTPNTVPDLEQLDKMAWRFAPAPMKVDVTKLSAGDHKALVKLIAAARILNDVFMKQYWDGDTALYERLKQDSSPLGKARLHYFWLNKGPWSSIDEYKAFLPDVPARKPLYANFYPPDMSKEAFEKWCAALPKEEQEQAKSFFTVIRWKDANKSALTAIPYSKFYQEDLSKAAALLREAASLTDNASLKKFLDLRADALGSNVYYDSDVAWMDLDAPIDVTFGPYETYNDELFGYKAAFEAYINLRDDAETAKISSFSAHLQDIEDHLPLEAQYRNPRLGSGAAIRVVEEIISTGDGAHAVQTAAYNLPNDENVVQKKGTKRVMLKNVQEAKFKSVLTPIARKTLPTAELGYLSFEMFFTHILAHELMHGLGPHQITVAGRATTPREQLKDLYSAIEEAKADVTGLFALQYMMEHARDMGLEKTLPSDETAKRQLYTTYLASMFRSVRFGLEEAHGKGTALQFNFLSDKGAVIENADGTFSIDMAKIKDAVIALDHVLLTLEATGDYSGTKDFLSKYAVMRPSMKKALDGMHEIPNDIQPKFITADELH